MNYRPVSGLCFILKLVERVVASQLNDYVCSNGLENIKQLAYKLGHSTETALLLIKNDIHLALIVLDWFKFYLSDRSQCV